MILAGYSKLERKKVWGNSARQTTRRMVTPIFKTRRGYDANANDTDVRCRW